MKNKKAILWDNDGVLVDTEKWFFEATRTILAQAGYGLTRKEFIETTLVGSLGPWQRLQENGLGATEIRRLKTERDRLYTDYLLSRELSIDGVRETVERLSRRYTMGIVTSSHPEHFDIIHARTGLLPFFDFVLTREDYTRPKPNPEPYRLAAQRSGYPPEQCVSIEDSRRGLLASLAASVDCIVVPQAFTAGSDFSEAALVLHDITELTGIL